MGNGGSGYHAHPHCAELDATFFEISFTLHAVSHIKLPCSSNIFHNGDFGVKLTKWIASCDSSFQSRTKSGSDGTPTPGTINWARRGQTSSAPSAVIFATSMVCNSFSPNQPNEVTAVLLVSITKIVFCSV